MLWPMSTIGRPMQFCSYLYRLVSTKERETGDLTTYFSRHLQPSHHIVGSVEHGLLDLEGSSISRPVRVQQDARIGKVLSEAILTGKPVEAFLILFICHPASGWVGAQAGDRNNTGPALAELPLRVASALKTIAQLTLLWH